MGGRAGWQGCSAPCLYRFPHSRAGLLSLRSVGQGPVGQAGQTHRFPPPLPPTFPYSSLPGSEETGAGPHGLPQVTGVGAASERANASVSQLVSSRECNAALTFLRDCPRDLIKEGGKLAGSWLGLQGWDWGWGRRVTGPSWPWAPGLDGPWRQGRPTGEGQAIALHLITITPTCHYPQLAGRAQKSARGLNPAQGTSPFISLAW